MVIDDQNSEMTRISINSQKNSIMDDIKEEYNDIKVFSKRILCELIKSECEDWEKEKITEIANKVNPILDLILNKNKGKINVMQNFITYIIEVDSELIKTLPEYENLEDEIFLRFIITAKNLYNYAFEVYFSLYDLFNVRISFFT